MNKSIGDLINLRFIESINQLINNIHVFISHNQQILIKINKVEQDINQFITMED